MLEWVVASARGRGRIAAALVVVAAVLAVCVSSSRGDLASQYHAHQQQASQLQSAIKSETATIRTYEGSLQALQKRLTSVQNKLAIQERLLAQVQTALAEARQRMVQLKAEYARDRRLLAKELVANYETPPPNLVDVVLMSNGFQQLLEQMSEIKAIARANAHTTQVVAQTRIEVAKQAKQLSKLEAQRQKSEAAVLAEHNQLVQLRLSIVDRKLASVRARTGKQRQLAALQKTLSQEEKTLQRQETIAAAAAFQSERIPVSTKSGSYINPLRYVDHWERTDMGVDANMPVGAPILAPGKVKILAIEPDWYAGQPLVYWELLDGPNAGMEQYVAEEITQIAPPGAILQQGQTIASYAASGTGIEFGWSTPSGVTLAVATTGYEEGQVTPAGVSIRNWLNALGAGAGPSY